MAEGEKRSWSDAPEDILSLILSKLYAGKDVVVFSAVCKTWESIPRVAQKRVLSDEELRTSPCLIFPDTRIFHPMYNDWFKMDSVAAFPEGVVHEQKYGWLLMVERDTYCAFFFNPFTGERIDLPNSHPGYTHTWLTFSTQPTSPDCQTFDFVNLRDVTVQTIKRGEAEFSIRDVCIAHKLFFTMPRYKVVFFRGEYYCLNKLGNVAIYNESKRKHRLTAAPTQLWKHFCASDCGRFLLEGEGHLWAVFVAYQGREVCVCKLNLSNMEWERVYDLEDRMIFLSYRSCLMERAKVGGSGNKIYFPKLMNGNCLFYSLSTNKYHTFAGGAYESFHGSRELAFGTWIQMNNSPSQTCGEQLSWR